MIDALAGALGVPPPRMSLPIGVALALTGGLELGAKLLRRKGPPALTRYGVRLVACHAHWDITRARQRLG